MKVEVIDLKRYFGETRAVDGISFSFAFGQVYGFVGPNGAGKTTTMRIMASLDDPDSGDVRIDGCSVVEEPEKVRGLIGFMPDSLPRHRDITVFEYLDFFARVFGLRGAARRRIVEDVTHFTGLTGMREKHIDKLSKGMKQRVSLARALVHDPSVLIMDEPAAGLDPKARLELRELIRALAESGKAILISSHILGELAEMCDGTVIIERGKLLRAGHMDTILEQDHLSRTLWIRPMETVEPLYRVLLEMPAVEEATIVGDEVRVTVPASDQVCADLLHDLVRIGIPVLEFRRHKADLEEVFMNVTRGQVQ